MAHKAKITSVEKVRHQASNSNFLDVAFDILDSEDTVVASRRIGLDPQTSPEAVEAEVQNHIRTYGLEQAQAVVQRELDKEDENIVAVRDALKGKEVVARF